ncbi:3-dehydroquinate synthase II [Methanohalophilus sp. RSK]|uniref:3-dehydroquinate synthase II n=1 Tax=Methanohalophilus sp. RSK TaxID=2485783 RepID=UPI000F4397BC|nr:3-dehydroquinate synthase II [Methanohalophilus sp. RSK]RNI15930.1 3-dehydroquinate synthase II [Methanohalophilus sp. RSK]
MKKQVWIRADEGDWEDKKERITGALESGADCVLVEADDVDKARELGDIKIAAFTDNADTAADIIVIGRGGEGDGTLPLPVDMSNSRDFEKLATLRRQKKSIAALVVIQDKKYEKFAAAIGTECDYLIAIGTDWKVIPLENLIAQLQDKEVNIISGVRDPEEAKLALETMEHGSDGVLLDTANPDTLKKTVKLAEEAGVEGIDLVPATITKIEPVGMGDRVCVDTCNLMERGEGMLVGSQSAGMFLVHSESEESPYVASRPFRVNAGAVHAYVKIGDKTRYLSELEAGDEVTIVNTEGQQRKGIVGRVKIERRPLMLVEAQSKDGNTVKNILQNAETIKLVSTKGKPVSIASLKEGDEVLVHMEDTGRHFGMKVQETIIEK